MARLYNAPVIIHEIAGREGRKMILDPQSVPAISEGDYIRKGAVTTYKVTYIDRNSYPGRYEVGVQVVEKVVER